MIPIHGIFTGLIVSAQDPEGRGRARLQIPQIMGSAVTGWAEPVVAGAARPGDQVRVAFEGGDRNYPIYWPNLRGSAAGWQPLILAPGWVPGNAADGEPIARLTADGMIELQGSANRPAGVPPPGNVTFATLPPGMRPLYSSWPAATTASTIAQSSRAWSGYDYGEQTTTSTTYVTGSTVIQLNFIAPASGTVSITIGAYITSSTTTSYGNTSVRVTQGSTTVLDPSTDRYAITVVGGGGVSSSVSFPLDGLTMGLLYTATLVHKSGNAQNTARFRNRSLWVDPVQPNPNMVIRVGVMTDGSVNAFFPHGSSTGYLVLSGVRARAA
ncbi:phage baseplate assembly protein V [Streptomyces roseifaciens]